MSELQILLNEFKEIADNPRKQMDEFLKQGKKVILCSLLYTPEEIVHSLGAVPMGVWGADMEVTEAKKYFPAFIPSCIQTILELGIKGSYDGASGIIIPPLSDSLKTLGENWKYAVKDILFIPVTYPQNRMPDYGYKYTIAGYERVKRDVETLTGNEYDPEKLKISNKIYNEHNEVMREVSKVLADHPEVSTLQRTDIFKSAFFMLKEDHTKMVRKLIDILNDSYKDLDVKEIRRKMRGKKKILVSGILSDCPDLLKTMDENNLVIAADDIAAESRQYKTDVNLEMDNPLHALADKFRRMKNCSMLYDPFKERIDFVVDLAKESKVKGVLFLMTKFSDPEEFDYPLIKKGLEENGFPTMHIEVDRQMENYQQAKTILQALYEII